MPVINRIAAHEPDIRAWRRHLHGIPELGFDLFETSAFVAARLREIGVDVCHEGIARTGVVALIHGSAPGPVVGLRADMDALPIAEATGAPHASRNPGVMHACGHDGHTAILLGAARYLAETRRFAGTVALIFQPSEEFDGGGEVMCAEGIMPRFGIERVYALHNAPGIEFGRFETRPGPLMAAADEYSITLRGRGGHAARPHDCLDPVPAAIQVAQGLYALSARRVDPLASAVISLTILQGSAATNVIPDAASLAGTVRTLDETLRQSLAREIARLAEGVAAAHGLAAEVAYEFGYPVTVNDPAETAFCAEVAAEIAGPRMVTADRTPEMGSEDFAYMLQERPGAYVFLGAGPGPDLHTARFDFNDDLLSIGASYFARIVERALPLEG